MRTFIVEDAEVVRDRIISLLGELDAVDVVGYADGAASAITAIASLDVDIVLLDLHLTEGSGLEVLAAVRKLARPPFVIVLTNHAYTPYRTKCLEAGANYFLDKSTEFERVVEVIRQLPETRRS